VQVGGQSGRREKSNDFNERLTRSVTGIWFLEFEGRNASESSRDEMLKSGCDGWFSSSTATKNWPKGGLGKVPFCRAVLRCCAGPGLLVVGAVEVVRRKKGQPEGWPEETQC